MAIKIGISTIRTVLQNGFSIKKDDSQKSKNVDPKKLLVITANEGEDAAFKCIRQKLKSQKKV